jgi:hypothetical protein
MTLTNDVRRTLVLATMALAMAACGKPSTTTTAQSPATLAPTKATTPAPDAPSFMFVQVAEDLTVDPARSTLRLVKVNQQTLYFSDRPNRIAGHIKMPAYLWQWTAAAGANNLTNDPPNATLSVYEPGQADNTIAVVKINQPVVDGNDLVYNYQLIEGTLPASGGQTALFIDMVGVGGGVGAGFHGVGVGGRGVGVR